MDRTRGWMEPGDGRNLGMDGTRGRMEPGKAIPMSLAVHPSALGDARSDQNPLLPQLPSPKGFT